MFWKILGIEPTDDIKTIKKAYAALAKKYNPEEHPEEFQKVYGAYKSACAWAKNHSAAKTSAALEETAPLSSDKNSVQMVENNFDFSPVPERTENNSSGTVNVSSAMDFSTVRENTTSKTPVQPAEFDFSEVKSLRQKKPQRLTQEDLVKLVLKRFEELLDDPTTRNSVYMWNNFFGTPLVRQIINDKNFRHSAHELIGKRKFNSAAAHTIASAFAGRARVINYGIEYYVDITGRKRKSYYNTSFIYTPIAIIIIIAFIMFIFIEAIIVAGTNGNNDYQNNTNDIIGENRVNYSDIYSNYGSQEDKIRKQIFDEAGGNALSDTTFSEDTLYSLAEGAWTATSDSLIIFEIRGDYTCSFLIRNQTHTGTVEAKAAYRGAQIELTMTADSYTYHFTVKMLESGDISAAITDDSGVVTTAKKLYSSYSILQ